MGGQKHQERPDKDEEQSHDPLQPARPNEPSGREEDPVKRLIDELRDDDSLEEWEREAEQRAKRREQGGE